MAKLRNSWEGAKSSLDDGRGERIKLVDERLTTALDLHHNTLFAHGTQGRYHRDSKADNVYIVTSGKGELVADGVTHEIYSMPIHNLTRISSSLPPPGEATVTWLVRRGRRRPAGKRENALEKGHFLTSFSQGVLGNS